MGKKLENPYTVTVMNQAVENLKKTQKGRFLKSDDRIAVETTDLYVRFLPKSDEEKETLQAVDGLELFDFPLDHELAEGVAGAFHDPSVPEGEITWQYTVVPVDYQFRDVEHEVLAELFLQDEEEDTKKGASNPMKQQLSGDQWAELQNEAFRITGNVDDMVGPSSLAAKKWYPKGTIRYEDNTTSPSRFVPLRGARVVVKRWFKWKSDITDSSGDFSVGKFRSSKVKCAIKWERYDWDIRSGSYGQAWYSFETLEEGNDWDKTIKRAWTPRNWLYASVHRGAMEYFYNYRAYGIQKPYHKIWFLKRRLHIGAKWKESHWFPDHYFTFNKIWWAAPVVIYSGNKDSRNIVATTIHELAHVSHWEIGYSTGQYVIDALVDDPFLPESWAKGVEYTVTNRVYPNAVPTASTSCLAVANINSTDQFSSKK